MTTVSNMNDMKDSNEARIEYVEGSATVAMGPVEKPEGKIYLTTSATHAANIKIAKDGHTILVPQPSNDPNDPLNWTWLRKHMILIIISFTALLPEYGSAIGAVTLFPQASQWHITPDHVNHSQAGNVFVLGVGGLFAVVLMAYFGRLPVLFWFLTIAFAMAIWCATALTFESYMAARILNGFFSAVCQAAATIFVNDLFFFHEKARKIGIWLCFVLCAPFLGPMLGAFMLTTQKWMFPFWVLAGITGLSLALVVVFVDETYYNRRLETDDQPAKKSRLRRLVGIEQFHSRQQRSTIRQTIRRPAKVICAPTVFISVLYVTATFAWQVGVNTTAVIFLTPLYHFTSPQFGYFYFAPVIGAILGECAGYFMHDFIAKRYIQKHDGDFHPEVRLLGCWVATPFLAAGLVLIGFAIQDRLHYLVLAVGWVLFNMGTMISIVSINTYVLDSYPEASGEGGGWLNCGRTIGGFIISYEQVSWATKQGAKASFAIQAGICAIALILILFMQIYGQRLRNWYGSLNFRTV